MDSRSERAVRLGKAGSVRIAAWAGLVLVAAVAVLAVWAGAFADGLGPGPAAQPPRPAGATAGTAAGAAASAPAGEAAKRKPAEVDAVIAEAGDKLPEWWDSAPLTYPPTLDLAGKDPAKGWAPQKNLGAYVWDVINPDPAKWREGVKLLHHVRDVRKGDPPAFIEATTMLGGAYFHLLRDWARAAFYYRQTLQLNPRPTAETVMNLAECYWRLGGPSMARELLQKYNLNRRPFFSAVKLYADMGDTTMALALADLLSRAGLSDEGNLYAGYACRRAGMNDKALEYFEKVLAVDKGGPRLEINKGRATANAEALRLRRGLDLSKTPDGTYTAASRGYKSDVQVEVVVAGGKMQSAKVTQHKESVYYTALTEVPRQIVETQGVDKIDAVTSATITSEAIVNAATKALAGAAK